MNLMHCHRNRVVAKYPQRAQQPRQICVECFSCWFSMSSSADLSSVHDGDLSSSERRVGTAPVVRVLLSLLRSCEA